MVKTDSGRYPSIEKQTRPSQQKCAAVFEHYVLAAKALRPELREVPFAHVERGNGACIILESPAARTALERAGWSSVDSRIHGKTLCDAFHKLAGQLRCTPEQLDGMRRAIAQGKPVRSYDAEMERFAHHVQGLKDRGGMFTRIVLRPRFVLDSGFSIDLTHPTTKGILKALGREHLSVIPAHPDARDPIAFAFQRLERELGLAQPEPLPLPAHHYPKSKESLVSAEATV